MPKRRPEHLTDVRRQILDAAVRCFVRDGFHSTSMSSLVAESGLSAGTVYRYFPGKSALIRASAELVLSVVERCLEELSDAEHLATPADTVAALVKANLDLGASCGIDLTRLSVLVWGEAPRDEALATMVRTEYETIGAQVVRLVRRWQAAETLNPAIDPHSLAGLIFASARGFLVQHLLLGKDAVPLDEYVEALDMLATGRPTTRTSAV